MPRTYGMAIALLLGAGTSATTANAQATRTWVSGVGDDANPCSRTAPCKTFAGAISKTAAQGEINVLDSGGFGGVTITKSISIIAIGTVAGVLVAAGTNAIVVNAAATDVVQLVGLDINGLGGAGSSLAGVKILQARTVVIRNSIIRGFRGAGTGIGIALEPTAANAKVHVSDTLITDNNIGVQSKTTGTIVGRMHLDGVRLAENATAVVTNGGNAEVRMSQSTITFNTIAMTAGPGSSIISFGNNAIISNGSGETPTSTIALK